jgi:hypothetical protein
VRQHPQELSAQLQDDAQGGHHVTRHCALYRATAVVTAVLEY